MDFQEMYDKLVAICEKLTVEHPDDPKTFGLLKIVRGFYNAPLDTKARFTEMMAKAIMQESIRRGERDKDDETLGKLAKADDFPPRNFLPKSWGHEINRN
jgi:hypothetical protein